MKIPSLLFFKKSDKGGTNNARASNTGIFISYRRNDQAGFAGRLADQLEAAFSEDRIFRDVESIAPGENFVLALNKSLDACSALLVIIGPAWLDDKGPDGKSRIFSQKDWVRAELEIALAKQKKIFPILVNGAAMPTAEELPESLHKMLEFNAHEVSDKRWDYDVGKLIRELSNIPGLEPLEKWKESNPGVGIINKLKRRGKLAIAGAGLFALLALSALGYLFLSGSKHCNTIYDEQVISLNERVKNFRNIAKGEIKKSRLNELSDSAKSAALNLKTCCIILDKEQINSEQFLECKNSADNYSSKLDELLASLNEANESREEKKVFGVFSKSSINEKRLVVIESKLDALLLASRDLDERVSTIKSTIGEPPKTEQPKSQSKDIDTEKGIVQLKSVYADTGEKIGDDVSYHLYDAQKNAQGKRKRITYSDYKPTVKFTVPPGKYHLWVGYGEASVETELEVQSGKLLEQTMSIPVGHIQLNATYQETDKKIEDGVSYYLYEAQKNAQGERKRITYSDYKPTAKFTVPPGKYHLWVGYGEASVETELEVQSGKLLEQTMSIPVGHIQLNATYQETDKKIEDGVSYHLYDAQKNTQGERKRITYSDYKPTAKFTVPPGKYHLWVGYGEASVETELEVQSGKLLEQTMSIPVGHIQLNAAYQETDKKIEDGVSYYLYEAQKNAQGERKRITYSDYKPTAKFTVPPGKYYLWVGYGEASVDTELEVQSGKLTKKTLIFQQNNKE